MYPPPSKRFVLGCMLCFCLLISSLFIATNIQLIGYISRNTSNYREPNVKFDLLLFLFDDQQNDAFNDPPSPSPAPAPAPILPPPPPQFIAPPRAGNGKEKVIIGILVSIIVIMLFIAIFYFLRIRNVNRRNTEESIVIYSTDVTTGLPTEEYSQYDFATIRTITNNFSPQSKIGQGGFGPVYKGVLPNGEEVALKRLSKSLGQGIQEFKNEVDVVVKLQHRNLVRLLGFCSRGEEKILIYEFVPNKSLDYFLYDLQKRYLLDWSRRYMIIRGIARGLLYLHEDSRLKIIHRDLKPSNILLDENLNPKISDFGMARIVAVDQGQGSTETIVGTYGYMSPEYVMHGEFSVKSDIFSFGVILLEIITGKKNRNFIQPDRAQDLLSYAWEQWRDGTPLHILDPILDCYEVNEVMQCIHIGLLCVQEGAEERPTMAEVMLMLTSYSANSWSPPGEPAFYRTGSKKMMQKGLQLDRSSTVNKLSISELCPR